MDESGNVDDQKLQALLDDPLPVFFIKKKPTLQVVFHRIFHPNFEKSLHELTVQERQHVIDYCKYRLGIETDLNTVKAFKACRDA
ncbi:hypothetical protein IFR09_17790 [Pseudomonas syringae]|nr:hypothetical protein [Pseudomonas syringae]MBD8576406.1 hypothetical protein [Pseudomonas syringae]MBD8791593.1 hypothetical protein [Pseudomonas syringae]MBD8802491.1 hypothetical protein [Pseudomonas syringae]MBD8813015.1 hypothetical protein [Pseudomonas syringae]